MAPMNAYPPCMVEIVHISWFLHFQPAEVVPPQLPPRQRGRCCQILCIHHCGCRGCVRSRIIRLDRVGGRHDRNESVPFDRSLPFHRRRRESFDDARPKFVHSPLYRFDYCTFCFCFLHRQPRRLRFVPQGRPQLVEPKNDMLTVSWVHRYRGHFQLGDRCISDGTKPWFLETCNQSASSSLNLLQTPQRTVGFCSWFWYYQWSILQDMFRLSTTVWHCTFFGTTSVPTLGVLVRSHKHQIVQKTIRVPVPSSCM